MNLNKYIEEASEEIMEKAYADPMFYKELEDAVRKALTAYNNDVVERLRQLDIKDMYGDEKENDDNFFYGDIRFINRVHERWRVKRDNLIKKLKQ